jgi:hypothetical protein
LEEKRTSAREFRHAVLRKPANCRARNTQVIKIGRCQLHFFCSLDLLIASLRHVVQVPEPRRSGRIARRAPVAARR